MSSLQPKVLCQAPLTDTSEVWSDSPLSQRERAVPNLDSCFLMQMNVNEKTSDDYAVIKPILLKQLKQANLCIWFMKGSQLIWTLS